MSFLNPISVPVKVYKSSDQGAPILNFSRRSISDVKTILKACLVTGYGEKDGAGWQMENEADNKATFWADNVAMADYRYTIDGSLAKPHLVSYQGIDQKISNGAHIFRLGKLDGAKNNWYVIASDFGFFYIECYQQSGREFANFMYFGRLKSALLQDSPMNIAFISSFNTIGAINQQYAFWSAFYKLATLSVLTVGALGMIGAQERGISALSVTMPLYLLRYGNVVAQLVGVEYTTTPSDDAFAGTIDDGKKLSLDIIGAMTNMSSGIRIHIDLTSWEF